ncbi:MAG: hypothetical protein V7752_12290 [Halopseudomonas sp.]
MSPFFCADKPINRTLACGRDSSNNGQLTFSTFDHSFTLCGMDNRLNPTVVGKILLATLVWHSLFVAGTDLASLGLGSAGKPQQWTLWRYLIAPGWLMLAGLIFIARHKLAHRQSFIASISVTAAVALILASIWSGMSGSWAIFGSAITYSLQAGLLCLTIRNHLWACFLAVILLLVQIVVDIIGLGIAGQFRIH